jgi:hypothetical protein
MGRSVNYLNGAERVNYFEWPKLFCYNEETGIDEATEEFEDSNWIIGDIQEHFMNEHLGFDRADKWGGRETHIILEGYGLQIGLSEYCGLATLSVRVNENELEYFTDDKEYHAERNKAIQWIESNWDEASKYWNKYKKVGTFSNGSGIYETIKG